MSKLRLNTHFYAQAGVILLLIVYWLTVHLFPSPHRVDAAYHLNKGNYDPEAAYSLSSLDLIQGETIYYVDHPGTPPIVIGALLYVLTMPFINGDLSAFLQYHLENQWLFLSMARFFLLFFSAVCVVVIFKVTRRFLPSVSIITSIAIALSFYAFTHQSIDTLTDWSHNSFSFPFGTLILLIAYVKIRQEEVISWQTRVLLGFLSGILTSVQIYYGAWVAGIIIALMFIPFFENKPADKRRQPAWQRALSSALIVGIASLGGFVFGTIPIISEYDRFFSFFLAILFNQGRYGAGEPGIVSTESFSTNLHFLFELAPLLMSVTSLIFVIATLALLLGWKHFSAKPRLYGLLIGYYVLFCALLFAIIKHPSINYLPALTALFPLFLLIGFELLRDSAFYTYIKSAISLSIIGIASITFTNAFLTHVEYLDNIERGFAEYDALTEELSNTNDREFLTLVDYRSLPSQCVFLWFGNDWTFGMTSAVRQVCPIDIQRTASDPNAWDIKIFDREEPVSFINRDYGIPISSVHVTDNTRYGFMLNPARLSQYYLHEIMLDFDYTYGGSTNWHLPERIDNSRTYQWMNGAESSLSLRLYDDSDYTIRFNTFSFDPEQPTNVTLTVNDSPITLTHDSNTGIYSGTITQDIIQANDANTFTFHADTTYNLLELGFNDTRIIGAGFDWIELEKLSE